MGGNPPRALPGWAVRGAALAVVFLCARGLLVALRLLDGGGSGIRTLWAPAALLHEDMLVASSLAALDAALWLVARRSAAGSRAHDRSMWLVYALAAGYTACSVPVARVLSTPLTYELLGTAGGALADSIRAYVTPGQVLSLAAIAAVAALAPRLVPRVRARLLAATAAVVLALALPLGRAAIARVDGQGLHRNALLSITRSTLVRLLPARAVPPPHGVPPLPVQGDALDLSRLAGAARGRHVLWVILESTGAGYLRPYGAEIDATPHLTALAQRAVLFTHAYASYPESIKGLYAMLCAAYPAPRTAAEDYARARLTCDPVAERLLAAGYRTGIFHSGRFVYLGMEHIVRDRGFAERHDAATIGGAHVSSFGTDDLSTARRVLAFVDTLAPGERFFALYMPIAGHHPYRSPGNAPRPYPERTEFDRYQNDLHVGDAALGELVAGLARRGLLDDTLLAVVGDHGEAFGQHEGNVAHSMFVYEENVHVPLLFVLPGVVRAPLRAPQIASTIDVAPTILDLLGLERPSAWQGRSLLAADPGAARFFSDHVTLKLGLRHGPWKFIHEVETGRSRLFDVVKDPREQVDLARVWPARVASYRDHLTAWADAQRARVKSPAPPP